MEQLGKSKDSIEEMARVDSTVGDIFDRLNDVMANLEDVSFTIRNYKEDIVFDDTELDALQHKLNKLMNLKRKYGPELADVSEYKKTLAEKIEQIEKREIYIDELDQKLKSAKEMYLEQAFILSDLRQEFGVAFSKDINWHLKELAMENAEFKVVSKRFLDEEHFKSDGIDDIEFYVRTNVGEEIKPLIKIASGGEVSRMMLAIKSAISDAYSISTMVFDEIDTGISGNAAGAVGAKLKELSKNHQIISITHLPQIASMAEAHFEVLKKVQGNMTTTSFDLLSKDRRVKTIAMMIDGSQTQKSLEHAKEILMRNSPKK
jgi:DNA repair protein RecN (Recombination protein N)